MASQGFMFQRSTMARWSNRIAHEVLKDIYDRLAEDVLSRSARLFADETSVEQLDPGQGKTRLSYMYALHRDDRSFGGMLPPATLYLWRRTRAMFNINEFFAHRSMIVQHDGYAGYGHLGRPQTPYEDIVSVDCWAHVRRMFTDEIKAERAPHASEIVSLIRELYAVEASANGSAALVRAAARQTHSVRILERLKVWLAEIGAHYLEKSDMGKAIRYVQARWTGLTRFVDDGRIDLDNNPVERQFKQTILLRNNVLFIGSEEGGEAWAILSSLMQTCKLNNVDPHRYLLWVFGEITAKKPRSEYGDFLPWKAPLFCRTDLPRVQ